MKRFLATIVAFLTLSAAVLAQVPMTGAGKGAPGGGGGGPCAQYTTFIARTSGTSGTEQTAYQNLICGLVTDGAITGNMGTTGCGSLLDGLYIFATNTTTSAKLNLCGTAHTLTTSAAPNFTADVGYKGNAAFSTAFLDTGLNGSSAGSTCGNGALACNYAATSASVGAYQTTSRTTTQSEIIVGAFDLTNITQVLPYITGAANAIDSLNVFAESAFTNANGMSIVTRTASTTAKYYHYNATAQPTISTDSVSGTVAPNVTVYFLARNNNNVADSTIPDSENVSAGIIGGALSQAQSTAIATRINNYMKDISGSTLNVW